MTTSTSIVKSQRLRLLLDKGLKFRCEGVLASSEIYPQKIRAGLFAFAKRAENDFGFSLDHFADFIENCEEDVKAAIPELCKPSDELDEFQLDEVAMEELAWLHENFVVTSADKLAQKPSFVCRRFYAEKTLSILGNTEA